MRHSVSIEPVGWRRPCQRERVFVRKRQPTCCEEVASTKCGQETGALNANLVRSSTSVDIGAGLLCRCAPQALSFVAVALGGGSVNFG